jgi:O-antigen/teichoic acid export membrane protein
MAMSEGMRLVSGNLSIIFLGLLTTSALVGVFRVANSVAVLVALPVSLVHVVVAPMISKLHAAGQRKEMQKILSWTAIIMVAGVSSLMLPLVFFGKLLLETIFGAEFSQSALPLVILCIGNLIGAAFGAGAILLNMTGHEKRVTRSFGISLVVLVVASFFLIKILGIIGAALANSISYVVWSVLLWDDSRRFLNLDASAWGRK